MATTLIDLNNNKLSFNEKTISIINVNNELWFKGIDIAKLLGYSNPIKSLNQHITKDKYKLKYENLLKEGTRSGYPLSYNDKNTIYINESGLYKLIFKSQLKIAEEFQEWIQDDVLPQIRKTGSYSIQSDRKLLETNFWNDNCILEYNNKNVIYIGYIGIHNNEQLFKFGISEQIYIREFEQHRKTFDIFKMVNIEICDNKRYVESAFKKKLSCLNLLRKQEFNSKNQTELFTITPQFPLDKIIELLRELIKNNPLPVIKTLNNELEECKNKYNELKDKTIELENKLNEIEENELKQKKENKLGISLIANSQKSQISNYRQIINFIQLRIERKKEEQRIEEERQQKELEEQSRNNLLDELPSINEIIDNNEEIINTESQSKQRIINKCMDCDTKVRKTVKRCLECYKKAAILAKERPSYEQLKEDIKELNYTGTGQKYNVSDNAIRKWIKRYEQDMDDEDRLIKIEKKKYKPTYSELMETLSKNTLIETANKYDVHRTTIIEWRKKYQDEETKAKKLNIDKK